MTIQNIIEIIGILIASLLGFAYVLSQVRRNDMQILRDANIDLRASLNDTEKKLADLKLMMISMEVRLKELEGKNKTLEDLVLQSLTEFFRNNPNMALEVKKKVKE